MKIAWYSPSAIAPFRVIAESHASGDFSPLWAGQNTTGCKEVSAGELTRQLAGRLKSALGELRNGLC